ncbi:MAG: FMN-binding protein [Lachnospiraceae bacterium]|nr:FMN-binding protein [Lachnospiraceae bacterium]
MLAQADIWRPHTISGATFSSEVIKDAVRRALRSGTDNS